jgi:hypothetical protein
MMDEIEPKLIPATGVTKSQLAAGVQESLDKADTALQVSALTPYRTAAAQDAIDSAFFSATDETLTEAGQPADAKATGDAIGELQTAVHSQLVPVGFAPNLKKGEYLKFADGAAASSNKYARTNSLFDGFRARTAVRFDSEVYECALSFYDADGTTSGAGYLGHTEYGGGILSIPAEAVRFGVSFRRVDQAALSDADVTAISAALLMSSCPRIWEKSAPKPLSCSFMVFEITAFIDRSGIGSISGGS